MVDTIGDGHGPSFLSEVLAAVTAAFMSFLGWFGAQTWSHAKRLAAAETTFKDLKEDNARQHNEIMQRLSRIESLLMDRWS